MKARLRPECGGAAQQGHRANPVGRSVRPVWVGAVLLFTIAWQAQAQSQVFTLDDCIRYALESSIEVKNAVLDEEIARARVRETRGLGLPQIDGAVGVTHNQQLRRFFAVYNGPNGFLGDLSAIPGIREGDVVSAENFFQLKSAADAGLNVNWMALNASYFVGLSAARAYRELSERATGQTREQTIVNVSKAYYLALINQERVKLFDANLSRVDSLLRSTIAYNQSGFAEKIEVDRVRVTFNNVATERQKFINLQKLALDLLKFQMNYPLDQPLALAGSWEQISIPAVPPDLTVDFQERWDYQVLMANKRLQQLDLRNQYAAGMPSLVAFANLGYATQSPNVRNLFRTTTNIPNDAIGPDRWYGYSAFGVSLNVPIFSSFQRMSRVQQARLTLLKIENAERLMQSSITVEARQSRIALDNALQSLTVQKENMDLAAHVARVTKIKYEQGVGSNIEVIDAEASLREAQVNYYNALYDALVARVDLDKALGKVNPVNNSK